MHKDFFLIEKAIIYIQENYYKQPSLKEIADFIGLSEYYFQKLFTRWAGVSPKKFLQYTTLKHAKQELKKSKNLMSSAFNVGLSTQSRLYDLFVTFEAVTPGVYKNLGDGITINYGINETPFGKILIALTEKGVSDLSFITESEDNSIEKLHKKWVKADIRENIELTNKTVNQIFNFEANKPKINLHVIGSNFAIKVWQSLLDIPEGYLLSYKDIAEAIGDSKASRAVGNAIRNNPIQYIIPCHRVLRNDGGIGGYAGGLARKRAILAKEFLNKTNNQEGVL